MAGFDYIHYKTETLDKEQTLAKLIRFEEVDKYRSFYKILPGVVQSTEEERDAITAILNKHCKQLITTLKADKKPHRSSVKKIINDCMKAVAGSDVSSVNKDFAYELCWYMSDIAGLEMRKASTASAWGYWDVILNEVKVIEYKAIKPAKKKNKTVNNN